MGAKAVVEDAMAANVRIEVDRKRMMIGKVVRIIK